MRDGLHGWLYVRRINHSDFNVFSFYGERYYELEFFQLIQRLINLQPVIRISLGKGGLAG
jgi:hypothetical protein